MKFKYSVKYNGQYYKAGEEVPVKEEKAEKPVEKKAVEKKSKE